MCQLKTHSRNTLKSVSQSLRFQWSQADSNRCPPACHAYPCSVIPVDHNGSLHEILFLVLQAPIEHTGLCSPLKNRREPKTTRLITSRNKPNTPQQPPSQVRQQLRGTHQFHWSSMPKPPALQRFMPLRTARISAVLRFTQCFRRVQSTGDGCYLRQ